MALEDIAPRIGKAHREVKEEYERARRWADWLEYCLDIYDPKPRRFSRPDNVYAYFRQRIERGELI